VEVRPAVTLVVFVDELHVTPLGRLVTLTACVPGVALLNW